MATAEPIVMHQPTANRLQKRFDAITRKYWNERLLSETLNNHIARYDRLTRRQAADIRNLEQAVARALDMRDQTASG